MSKAWSVCSLGGHELEEFQQRGRVPAGSGQPRHPVERTTEQPHGETEGK